ncbi:TOPRIM nucleotidyl transferase/hydrolase domain-containing protein [Pseudomonas capeferrum]
MFVEGDAEEALLLILLMRWASMDELGITLCNVAGTNFAPYVKVAAGHGLPSAGDLLGSFGR